MEAANFNRRSAHRPQGRAIGYFHIDIAEVRTEQGRLYLLVAIDRTSKFAFILLHEKATTRIAGDFLRHLIAAVPYKVHTVLTDNPVLSDCRRQAVEGGIHFTDPKHPGSAVVEIKLAIASGELFRAHSFELACAQNDIDHRLTKPRHPSTNGQVERMNGEIKRRTTVVGILPNEAAITRLVGAILMEQSDEWAVRRARYMTLEIMAPVSDNPIIVLSAVPET